MRRYWYIVAFQDLESGAVLSSLCGCEGTPPLPMVKFVRTIVHASTAEEAYEKGHDFLKGFEDEVLVNDYAFIADDFLQEVEE